MDLQSSLEGLPFMFYTDTCDVVFGRPEEPVTHGMFMAKYCLQQADSGEVDYWEATTKLEDIRANPDAFAKAIDNIIDWPPGPDNYQLKLKLRDMQQAAGKWASEHIVLQERLGHRVRLHELAEGPMFGHGLGPFAGHRHPVPQLPMDPEAPPAPQAPCLSAVSLP
jgi:hypothetical protein